MSSPEVFQLGLLQGLCAGVWGGVHSLTVIDAGKPGGKDLPFVWLSSTQRTPPSPTAPVKVSGAQTTLPSVKVLSSRRESVSKPRTLVLLRPELESYNSSGCENQQPSTGVGTRSGAVGANVPGGGWLEVHRSAGTRT